MIVVVGGQASKVGKTQAVCDIISSSREANWTAVKISPHPHGEPLSHPILHEEVQASSTTDTGRYLQAGARRAIWVRVSRDQMARILPALLQGNVILESNSALDVIKPDFFLFVSNPDVEHWKESAWRHVGHADALVERRVSTDTMRLFRRRLMQTKPDQTVGQN